MPTIGQRYTGLVGKYAKSRQRKPDILAELRPSGRGEQLRRILRLAAHLTLPDDLTGMIAECQAIDKREKRRKQREEAKQAREALERVQKWVDGESDYCPSYGPIRLRVKGDELQTTLARGFPLHMPSRLSGLSSDLHDKGQAYQRNGHTIHLGQFALDSLDTEGNVTGRLPYGAMGEITRVAGTCGGQLTVNTNNRSKHL